MTATEELRRMLDERGVEWWQSANTLGCVFTRWYSPLFGDEVCAMENGEEGLVLFDHFVTPEQAIAATLGDVDATSERQRDAVEVVRCRDCKHGHITINGKSCKWCDLIATHDIDGNEPNNGYDPEPYFDADFFCAWGERREVDA